MILEVELNGGSDTPHCPVESRAKVVLLEPGHHKAERDCSNSPLRLEQSSNRGNHMRRQNHGLGLGNTACSPTIADSHVHHVFSQIRL